MHSQTHLPNHHRTYFPPLTSLRFFAAFFIFLLHSSNHNLLPSVSEYIDLSHAVTFFFVLSGFVLSNAYLHKKISFSTFCVSRLARIWPTTVLSTLFVVFFIPSHLFLPFPDSAYSPVVVFFTHLVCVQSLIPLPSFYFGFNAVAWSISVELTFYIIFYFVRSWSFNSIISLLLSNITLALIGSLLLHFSHFASFSLANLDSPTWQGFIYINPISRLPEFLMGVLAHRIFILDVYGLFFRRLSLSNSKSYLWLIHIIACFFSLLLAFYAAPTLFSFIPDVTLISISQISSSFFFAIFILLILSANSQFVRLLSHKIFIVLGNSSFAFYLFHQPIMIKAAQSDGFKLLSYQLLPNNFFSVFFWTIALSLLCYTFFEKPARKLILLAVS